MIALALDCPPQLNPGKKINATNNPRATVNALILILGLFLKT